MQIRAFRVRKFRNIEDSGKVELLDSLTCVVGKNQAGKSALLRALHKFNPHQPEPYDMRREWPRGQRTSRNKEQVVCEVQFDLSAEELEKLGEIASQKLKGRYVVVTKDYNGDFAIQFAEDPTLFPDTVQPDVVDTICQTLPAPAELVGDNFRAAATKCTLEAKEYAKDGRFADLVRVRNRHIAILRRRLTKANVEPQRSNEKQFIEEYAKELNKIKAKLVDEHTRHRRAHDYIVSRLPTFIYMDDYKRFQGRANLEGLKERLYNEKIGTLRRGRDVPYDPQAQRSQVRPAD